MCTGVMEKILTVPFSIYKCEDIIEYYFFLARIQAVNLAPARYNGQWKFTRAGEKFSANLVPNWQPVISLVAGCQ